MAPSDRIIQPALILHGSARVAGNTGAAVRRLAQILSPEPQVVHLCSQDLRPYTYEGQQSDDFFQLIDCIVRHRQIVLATPVYWYAMSGLMKTFFDRLTDLLQDPQSRRLGRSLAGREVWLLATGTDEDLPVGFTEPFSRTCAYFDMIWKGGFYVHVNKGAPSSAQEFFEVDNLAALLTKN
jgi:multimeric flavodoxin WrbA